MDYRLSLAFRRPDIVVPDQDLVADCSALSENPDSYERRAVLGSVGIERQVTDRLTVGAGLSFELSRVTRDDETDEFFLVGVPLSLGYDMTDNLLDPTEGARLDLSLTPYPGRSEEHTSEIQSLMRNSYDVFCLK